MHLYRLLCDNLNNIKSIILDKDIFGVVKTIKVVFNDGTSQDFTGSEDKFIKLFYDLQEDKSNLLKRKIIKKYDKIDSIQILEREAYFSPSKIMVNLNGKELEMAGGLYILYDKLLKPQTEFDRYVLETFLIRYNTDYNTLSNKIRKDECIKEEIKNHFITYSRINTPFNTLYYNVKSSGDYPVRKVDEIYDSMIISNVDYKSIDIMAMKDNAPSSIVVVYSNDKSVVTKDINSSYKFIEEAKNRGLEKVNSYLEGTDPVEVPIDNFIKKEENKSLVKRLFNRIKKGE